MKKVIRKIEHFFWWASGANIDILEKLPTEHSKYTGIGGTIIFTALMASFAGGYAFFTAFQEKVFITIPETTKIIDGVSKIIPEHQEFIGYTSLSILLSIFFGIFWGLLIFNLDRYIVSSFGVGDGKKTISKQELLEGAPRIVMAIILGFVIATPLELKLFEKEINAEIDQKIAISNKQLEKNMTQNTNNFIMDYKSEISSLKNKISEREKIIENKRDEYYNADEEQRKEWNGEGPTGKKGKGPYWEELNNRAKELKKDLDKIENQYTKQNKADRERIEYLQGLVNDEELKIIKETEYHKTIQQQNDGLMARLEALHNLTSKNNSLLFAKWLITLLFIIIETAPILFKMMMESGPYDQKVDQIRYEEKIKYMQKNSNLNEKINFDLKIHTKKNEQRLAQELAANDELLAHIAQAQVEIANAAIDEWKKEKIKEARNNASEIIKSE